MGLRIGISHANLLIAYYSIIIELLFNFVIS